MDQLKVVLQHVKKHHFWLLCVLCLIAGLFAWNSASGKLSKDFDSRKGAISGAFSGLSNILSEPNYPNAQWQEEADKLTDKQKKRVRTAWQQVYDEQAPFFKWPKNLDVEVDSRTPMESKPRNSELGPRYRELYQRLINDEFPKLLEIVGARKHGNQGNAGADAPNMQSRVVWDNDSQSSIDNSLRFPTRPNSLEVWLTQENLWVYQVLLTIIQKVNADRYVPPVKKIDEILIAQEAAAEFKRGLASGRIAVPKGEATTGAAPRGPPRSAAPPINNAQGNETPALDAGRYVDATGNPMPVAPGPQQPFKRMPVFLKLVIDQREIGKLLVECANSPLPVEVRQLRVDPGKSDSGSGGSRRRGNATPTGPVTDLMSYDVPIEISGIIYLYNPPDKALLGSDEGNAGGAPVAPGG